jgi:hypothetical protein
MKTSARQARRPIRWVVLLPIVGGTCMVLVAIAMIVILAVRSISGAKSANPGMPLEVTRAATPAATPSPPAAAPTPVCDTVVSSGEAQQAVPLPISLTVGSRVLPVAVTVPSAGAWSYPAGASGAAAWVCGTVVNYVLQLEDSAASRELLEELAPGSSITLRLTNGTGLLFRSAERREVPAYDPATLAQARPSLTLVLPQDGATWQIVAAEYAAEAETAPSSTLAQLNQAVQVGELRLTVTRGHLVREGLALQPGTVAYVVEFTLENTGSAAVNTVEAAMKLQDGSGAVYLSAVEASAVGDFGPLSAELAPGASTSASAGYLVPETLAGPTLIWTFAPNAGAALLASVGIPYEGGPAVASGGQFSAALTDAFLSSDGATLIIEGEIRNTGQTPLTFELRQISLTSSAGLSVLQLAAPPLPWIVQPGQAQIVELQYARPNAPAALLTLAGYSFEIQNLE